MERILTKLATYKLFNLQDFLNTLITVSRTKFLLTSLLLISIIIWSTYLIFRLSFQTPRHISNTTNLSEADVPSLLSTLMKSHKRYVDNFIEISLEYIKRFPDIIKLPSCLLHISYEPETSVPLSYRFISNPVRNIPGAISTSFNASSRRIAFSGSTIINEKSSAVKFVLSEFTIDVDFELYFRNFEVVKIIVAPSRPRFSLFINSAEQIGLSCEDMSKLVVALVSAVPCMFENADDLYKAYLLRLTKIEEPELIVNFDEHENSNESTVSKKIFEVDPDNASTISNENYDTTMPSNIAPSLGEEITPTISPMYRRLSGSTLKEGEVFSLNDFSYPPPPLSPKVDEPRSSAVVLAHNPSLKKQLAASHDTSFRHVLLRSASEDEEIAENNKDNSALENLFDSSEPVPLDPIVHPTGAPEVEGDGQQRLRKSPNAGRKRIRKTGDVSPLRERLSTTLTSKNLLVKVVKADFIDLKSTSDAYCVVELDEPYQRHATHVIPPREQLFWDQHLLFGLNSNSKRAALEVFELSKRKKSISRGYAEICLSDLLTTSSSLPGGGELSRCIPLELKHHSSIGKWEAPASPDSSFISLNLNRPTITAEFHFMERITDDPFSVSKGLSTVNSPILTTKVKRKSKISVESFEDGSFNSPTMKDQLGDSNLPTDGAQNEKNLDLFSSTPRVSTGSTDSSQPSLESRDKDTENSSNELELFRRNSQTLNPEDVKSSLTRSPSVRGSRLFEPAYENLRESTAVVAPRSRIPRNFLTQRLSFQSSRKSVSRPAMNGMGLLGPSSQLAGVVAGLTAASANTEEAVDPSTAAAVASAVAMVAATGSASSDTKSGFRNATEEAVRRRSRGSALNMERRLKARNSRTRNSLFDSDPSDLATSDLEDNWVDLGVSSRPSNEPLVRYAAPAASFAESPGTYSAQPQTRRSDMNSGGIMRIFKTKKKPVKPTAASKFAYLDNLTSSEFDTISTEGYRRIVEGERLYDTDGGTPY